MAKIFKKEEVKILWTDDPAEKNKPKASKNFMEIVPSEYTLKIGLEKNKRGGKSVSIIYDFPENPSYFTLLAKELKKKCATGGSFKGESIEIQGDHRNRLKDLLEKKGFKVKLSGG